MREIFYGICTGIILIAFTSCDGINSEVKTMNIAMAQIFCLDGDREGNFVRIEHAIQEAKDLGADIVCFPEMAILGWTNEDAHERAFPIPGQDSDQLAQLAVKYNIFLHIGLGEKEGENLYDAAILLDNTGEILLKHRKINILTELMTPPYTPGSDVLTVDTSLGKIGVLICADSFTEGVLDKMKAQSPELLIIPYGWAKEEEDWPEHGLELERTVRRVANTVGCPVIGTDLVGEISKGPWAGLVYGGQSIAIDEQGTVLGKGKDRDRDIVLITLER